ncbi:hypothetical protein [Nannocystis punicea]|uniref:Uncharacterized protein n=1 Tax=Nannocystis punicea TaxID=2995304 RepID=A0ABY7GX85_9BACT|nr:hypothetical protein [Nannocystis poenicansa]WAS91490.1 hypothetical protein O0S08_35350 [Nannocystis poenicansa]
MRGGTSTRRSGRVLELAPAFWKQTAEQQDTQKRLAANVFRIATLAAYAHGVYRIGRPRLDRSRRRAGIAQLYDHTDENPLKISTTPKNACKRLIKLDLPRDAYATFDQLMEPDEDDEDDEDDEG